MRVATLRPDYLLGPAVIDYFGIGLVETTETDPAFIAELRTNAGYLQFQVNLSETLDLNIGARYEQAEQEVRPHAGLQRHDQLRGVDLPRQ